MVIGLTGGTGSGKTTALRVLRQLGAQCFDADAVYHGMLQSDGTMLQAIEAAFPGVVQHGVLDRRALGARVFGDAAALQRLSELTQPRVAAKIRAELAGDLCVIDAIGLFESGLSRLCDHTVAVLAPRAQRIARLIARDGLTEAQAARRIDAQPPDAVFAARCDTVLQNDADEASFEARCRHYFSQLCGKPLPK